MTWTAGYNNSIAYTTGYYHEQSPTFLNACLAMQRVSPPSLEKFTYCELGFGQGLTSLILAATHPSGDFYACDFNPLHVLGASSIRDEARLPNLTLLENSFGDLAQGQVELPMFDYITMHGIISWISDETRTQIMRFLTRYLKPGGVVQVSYNAMVGCAQVLPLQRLLMLGAGEGGDAWTKASGLAAKMVNLDALHFRRNPDSQGRVEGFATQDKRYLVHEYLHEKWTPFYFTDIAREMAEAKLSFAGSARFAHMSPVGWLGERQREMLETVTDLIEAEELRDYFANRVFRSDIFVRGKAPLSDLRLREQAEHVHVWGNPAVLYQAAVKLEHATLTRGEAFHKPLFDLLHGYQCDGRVDARVAVCKGRSSQSAHWGYRRVSCARFTLAGRDRTQAASGRCRGVARRDNDAPASYLRGLRREAHCAFGRAGLPARAKNIKAATITSR
jgi:SAM-dependent methyltransferase